jgi:hypothetical protein
VVGCCEWGDEPLGTVKCGEFLHTLASQEGLCCMQLVSLAETAFPQPCGSVWGYWPSLDNGKALQSC